MYRKAKKLFAVCLTVAMLLTMTAFSTVASAATSNRLQGGDRYATALNIVKAGWSTSEYAVLATGEGFADALAAAPLAKAYNAPILLVDPATDNTDVKAELAALGVKTVFIVGGEGVVSKAFADGLTGYTVNRLAGVNRVETSVKVAAELVNKYGTISEIVVANEEAYADALSIAPIAANRKAPILLVEKDSVPAEVVAFLTGKTITKTYVVGETGVVSDTVKNALPNTVRLGGANRYATNYKVLANFSDLNYSNVFLTTGENYPDALAGSAYAAQLYAPLVLVESAVTDDTLTLVKSEVSSDSKVIALGGAAVCPDAAVSSIASYIDNLEFKVKDITFVNAKQILVTFTQDVNTTDAKTAGSYLVADASAYVYGATVTMPDSKSALLTLTNPLVNGTTYSVKVNPVRLKADSAKSTVLYTTTFTANDKAIPYVKATSSITNGTSAANVTVTYNEPIKSGTVRIDGTGFAITSGLAKETYTLSLDASKTHTIEVINLTDFADNVVPYANTSFAVTVDKVSPVASVAPYGDRNVLVTFGKEMKPGTVIAANLKVKDELYGDVNATIGALPGDTTNTKFLVTIDDTLYATKSTRTLTLVFLGDVIEDSLGNKMTATTSTVVLTKDTVGPAVTDITFTKDVDGKVQKITVKYNEALKAAATVNASDLLIVDKNGALVTASGLNNAVVAANDTEVVFAFPAATLINNKWTITVPSALVKDASETGNNSSAFTKTLDFTVASAPSSYVLPDTGVVTIVDKDTITVNFQRPVKGGLMAGSATDPNNYSINGKLLPTGTKIYLNATAVGSIAALQQATITLPEGTVTADDDYAWFRVNNVQDANGVVVTPYTAVVAVDDNTLPYATEARILDANTIEVTFSEDMAAGLTGSVAGEFEIKNSSGTVFAHGGLVVSNVPGYAKKIRLTTTNALSLSTTYTLTTKTGVVVVDASDSNNVMKAGTTLTIAK